MQIVAAICCIEIPRKEWPGIAEKITANMSNEDLVVKEVSILTIGFICEQLREFNFTFEDQIQ
jgi:importin subunit beta-1